MSYLNLADWKGLDASKIVGATVATSLALALAVRLASRSERKKIYRSPRETLMPKLTEQEKYELPYPLDVLPGGRDVDTPYGTIRVYEFGPETGRKVLLVHGISTPCISLGAISEGLAEKGCRVMLFDLWGRGYSDAPADLDHDNRLYASQIMFAITSSELEWKTFDLIGYSLGGGISADFASYFPQMVESLVLLAPAGLIRPQHFGMAGKLVYSSGIFPERLLQFFVKRRLQSGFAHLDYFPFKNNRAFEKERPVLIALQPISRRAGPKGKKTQNVGDVIQAEAKDSPQASQDFPLSTSHPNVNIAQAVQWQVKVHTGFINSFVSSIRHAPITGQQATWKRLGLYLSSPAVLKRKGMPTGKILIIVGTIDVVIIPEELKEDLEQLLPEDYYQWETIEGGHDFPSTKSVEVVKILTDSWGL